MSLRVVAFSDAHVDAGTHLGDAHPDWGSTRLLDGLAALRQVCEEPCDVLLFCGDLFAGPNPRPPAIAGAQEALASSQAAAIVLLLGNHDHSGRARSSLDVVAAGDPRIRVVHEPELVDVAGVQIGALPWTPPQRLYRAEGVEDRAEAHARASDALHAIARGFGARLVPDRPAVLAAHWLVKGAALQSGETVLSAAEPLLDADDLEASGPWDVVVAGHNHVRQELGQRTWVTGAPLRHSFGEASLEPGYLVIDLPDAPSDGERVDVRVASTTDRPLATVHLDVDAVLDDTWDPGDDLDGAVVRLVGSCTDEQARALAADAGARTAAAIDACVMAGAAKVIGPQLEVTRERRARSELDVDVDPHAALGDWLGRQDLDEDTAASVREEATRIIHDEGGDP